MAWSLQFPPVPNPFEAQYFNFDSIPAADLINGASGVYDPQVVPTIRPAAAQIEAFFWKCRL